LATRTWGAVAWPGRNAGISGDALGRLWRNAAIEAGLGAIIVVIVAVLGVTPPALHPQAMPGMQHHSH
jgi:putative copper export protein